LAAAQQRVRELGREGKAQAMAAAAAERNDRRAEFLVHSFDFFP